MDHLMNHRVEPVAGSGVAWVDLDLVLAVGGLT